METKLKNKIDKIYIMHHTHWDREWYLDFETYRSKLKYGIIDLIDKLEKGVIKNFFFDGQTIIIEDVKDVLSDDIYNKFIKYIKDGVIELGPWYVLPDGFISDEESLIENIRIGKNISKKLNSKSNFGYFPDTFGQIGQTPTLLNEFNIPNALIHRGTKNVPFLVKWKSSNKINSLNTIVLNLREGYYQTIFHTPIKRFKEEFEKFINKAIVNVNDERVLLIMDGCDHTFPANDFDKKLSILKKTYPDIEFKEVLLSEFINKLNNDNFKTYTIEGEQRDPQKAFTLPSVRSTRTNLKIDNRKLIDKLTFVVEPFELLTKINESNLKQINMNFKNAIKNQPHDSILGCSIDAVHLDMETRTRNINSSLDSMIKYKFNNLSEEEYSDFEVKFNDKLIIMNNNLSNEPKIQKVTLKIPKKLDKGWIELLNLNSKEKVKYLITKRWEDEVLLAGINNIPSYQQYVFYDLELIQLPSSEIKFDNYKINLVKKISNLLSYKKFDSSINLNNLLIYIKDNNAFIKYNEEIIINITKFKSTMDAGDSYSFSPINNKWFESKLKSAFWSGNNNELIKFKFNVEHIIPKSLSKDRKKHSDKNIINEYEIVLTFKNKLSFDVEINVKNNSMDSKIVQDFEIKANEVYSDQAFEFKKRYLVSNINYEAQGENNSEISYPQFNSIRNVYLDKFGIQFNHIGLQEWDLSNGSLTVTLLRNIGWLSRRDMLSRKGGAGPSYPTPNAQNLGEHKFNYSFNLGAKKIDLNKHFVNVETPYHQGSKEFRNKIVLGEINKLMITRIKQIKHNNKNYLEVRVINPTNKKITINYLFNYFIIVDLEYNFKSKKVNTLNLEAKQFKTLLIERS